MLTCACGTRSSMPLQLRPPLTVVLDCGCEREAK
ncbi:hypothetical protein NC651_008432 [Populus alba x Populus x berolinensis]|nr:hypothetical protein NC651_008432 [Populus alba x Populus x berolinensis]